MTDPGLEPAVPSPSEGRWKRWGLDALAGISLANLLLLGTWHHLLYTGDSSDLYHMVRDPLTHQVALVNLLGVGLVLGLSGRALASAMGEGLRSFFAYVVAVAVTFALVRLWVERIVADAGVVGMDPGDLLAPAAVMLLLTVVLLVAVRLHPPWFRQGVRGALLIMVPFAFFHVAQLVPVAAGFQEGPHLDSFDALPEATLVEDGSDSAAEDGSDVAPRAVVLVFDELDGDSLEAALQDDPGRYPELDRLRREAAYSPDVHTPGPHTLYSLPALSLGELLERSRPLGPEELEILRHGQDEAELWDGRNSVFAGLREGGRRVALTGWYHPYCRVLREALDACHWSPWLHWIPENDPQGWVRASLVQWGSLLPYPELPAFLQNVRDVERTALDWAGDRRVDVLWVHHPLPHRPWLWEDESWFGRRFVWRDGEGYRRNLAEVDRFLGDLRERLREEDLLERTALMILSDHPQRYPANGVDLPPEDARIPLVVDLPWDDREVRVRSRCTPLYTGNLLHALLDGDLEGEDGGAASQEAVDRWIWDQGPAQCR